MKIKVPKQVQLAINDCGNKTAKANALKIYAALYKRNERKNKHGYFQCPSTYLKSINLRYYKVIDQLIECGIIDYYKRPIQDPNNLFETKEKKYYNKSLGICMSYKFKIDITQGPEVEVDMESNHNKRWYRITKSSLEQLACEDITITRDSFGRRVHHNLTQIYKEELKKRGFSVIDAKCSQPRLLWMIMKEKGISDTKYDSIFENGEDFYMTIIEKLNLEDRQAAKDLFMYWLNSNGYVPNYKIHILFPTASAFIKKLKNKNYKNASSYLQREESKIWIDDILENIPFDFGITIHDSLIVRDRDAVKALKFCKERHPKIEFNISEI